MAHQPPCEELERAKLEFAAEITSLSRAFHGLKDQFREGNRNVLLAVAAIGFVGVLVTVVGSWVGQKMAITAGASQAHIGAEQAVQSAASIDDTIFAAEQRGRTQENQRWIQWQLEHPLPIVKSPDVVKHK